MRRFIKELYLYRIVSAFWFSLKKVNIHNITDQADEIFKIHGWEEISGCWNFTFSQNLLVSILLMLSYLQTFARWNLLKPYQKVSRRNLSKRFYQNKYQKEKNYHQRYQKKYIKRTNYIHNFLVFHRNVKHIYPSFKHRKTGVA